MTVNSLKISFHCTRYIFIIFFRTIYMAPTSHIQNPGVRGFHFLHTAQIMCDRSSDVQRRSSKMAPVCQISCQISSQLFHFICVHYSIKRTTRTVPHIIYQCLHSSGHIILSKFLHNCNWWRQHFHHFWNLNSMLCQENKLQETFTYPTSAVFTACGPIEECIVKLCVDDVESLILSRLEDKRIYQLLSNLKELESVT